MNPTEAQRGPAQPPPTGGPRVDAAPAAPARPPRIHPALLRQRATGLRVLLVEDNVVNQEVATDLLQSVGLLVDLATNGAEAVQKVAPGIHDLVLMDVQMPVMDGLSATRAIRAAHGPALPIVALTAQVFGEDRQACLDAGMNDHVGKPVDPDVLYAALARWLPQVEPRAAPQPARAAAPPVTAAASSALLPTAALAGVDGLDLAAALHSVGGRLGLLDRMLRRFVEHYGAEGWSLAEPEREDRLPVLGANCHALRGACATIGAMPLAQVLQDLEEAVLAPPPHDLAALAAATARARADLRRLLDGLARALGL